ncbi:hypothetical protein BDR26DRAFT_938540 [Obelidium mucronatum]|nr:hypothetical protein BDR26DRAFT_938540 [Obelidium mucronatum]
MSTFLKAMKSKLKRLKAKQDSILSFKHLSTLGLGTYFLSDVAEKDMYPTSAKCQLVLWDFLKGLSLAILSIQRLDFLVPDHWEMPNLASRPDSASLIGFQNKFTLSWIFECF